MSDKELLTLLESDGESGIAQARDKYSAYVYAIVRDKLSAYPSEDIEETVSDVFIKLWQNRKKLDLSRGSIKAYICVLAKSTALRRREQLAKRQNAVSLDEISDYSADDDTISTELRRNELIDRLKSLDKQDRALIIYRYYYGIAYKEIAAMLDISEAAARKRTERILKKLAAKLEEVSL